MGIETCSLSMQIALTPFVITKLYTQNFPIVKWKRYKLRSCCGTRENVNTNYPVLSVGITDFEFKFKLPPIEFIMRKPTLYRITVFMLILDIQLEFVYLSVKQNHSLFFFYFWINAGLNILIKISACSELIIARFHLSLRDACTIEAEALFVPAHLPVRSTYNTSEWDKF